MKTTCCAQVGDIIQWPGFAYATLTYTKEDGNLSAYDSRYHIVHYLHHEEREDGWERNYYETIDLARFDPSRGRAHFEVIRAEMEGGSGPGAHDPYPDGWHVTARRLDKNETIEFYQSGCFNYLVPTVYLIGHKGEGIFDPFRSE